VYHTLNIWLRWVLSWSAFALTSAWHCSIGLSSSCHFFNCAKKLPPVVNGSSSATHDAYWPVTSASVTECLTESASLLWSTDSEIDGFSDLALSCVRMTMAFVTKWAIFCLDPLLTSCFKQIHGTPELVTSELVSLRWILTKF